MLLLKQAQLLLSGMVGLAHAAQEHLHQLVAGAGLGLEQQAQDQGMALAWLREITQVAHLELGGLGGELPDLGLRDPGQKWLRVNDRIQPRQPFGPATDMLQRGGPWRLLQAGDNAHAFPGRHVQQSIKTCGLLRIEIGGDRLIQGCVDLVAQVPYQAVQGAECGQFDVGPCQRLDREIDQVRGIAHRQCGAADDRLDQTLARGTVDPGPQMGTDEIAVAEQSLGLDLWVEQRRTGR